MLTLPSTLALAYPNENPSLNRAGVAIPVVFLLVSFPFAYLWRGFLRERVALRVAGIAALLAAASISVRENAESVLRQARGLLRCLDRARDGGRRRHAAVPHARESRTSSSTCSRTDFWVDARNIALELGEAAWVDGHNIAPPAVPEGLAARPLVFIYRATDGQRLEALGRLYPEGAARVIPQSHPDRNFGVYLVR